MGAKAFPACSPGAGQYNASGLDRRGPLVRQVMGSTIQSRPEKKTKPDIAPIIKALWYYKNMLKHPRCMLNKPGSGRKQKRLYFSS